MEGRRDLRSAVHEGHHCIVLHPDRDQQTAAAEQRDHRAEEEEPGASQPVVHEVLLSPSFAHAAAEIIGDGQDDVLVGLSQQQREKKK